MNKYRLFFILSFWFITLPVISQVRQKNISTVDKMANIPLPLKIIDWRDMALRFDKVVYNPNETGPYWPLIWIDSSGKNFSQPTLGIYTAIGDVRQGSRNNKGMFHEALANMGAVLGATLVGIDKSNQNHMNYVNMLKNYFNSDSGWDIMMNNTCPEVALLGGGYGRDWWYDVYPNLLFYAIYDKYPGQPDFDMLAQSIAEKFYRADSILNGNYQYSYFDYGQMKPMINTICRQPDAAAGHAWVLYAAFKKFGNKKYLQGAIQAMKALESNRTNPTYELLMPFGAYMAAVLNAEQGQHFDVQKMLDWTFNGTAVCRKGWGVLAANWNGFDLSGIVGSTTDHGGYGFLMNTFDAAWPLLPLVRYEPSYANAIGKWALNAANASRLFYPQYMPADHQTIPHLASVTKNVIAYEGIAATSTFDSLYLSLKGPVAQGDGPKWVPGKNPEVSQFSVYGSAHAGIFGATIHKTEIEGILKLDLRATDFFQHKAFPTFLYYNPHPNHRKIAFRTNKKSDLYDLVSQRFLARNVSRQTFVTIPPRQSIVIVEVPSGKKSVIKNHQMLIDGITVDYKK